MDKAFDKIPYGFERTSTPGYIRPAKGPLTHAVRQLKADKDRLEAELTELRGMVEGLMTKKGKK